MKHAAQRAGQARDFDLTTISTTHLLFAACGVCAGLWALVLLTTSL